MTKKIFADLAKHTVGAMRNLLGALPESAWDSPVSLEGFGPRELICHMADNEKIVLEWVQLAVCEPGATIDVPDALELAKTGNYPEQDPWKALDRFEKLRIEVCDFVESLTDEQLDRHISCPYRGAVTVHDQCVFLLGHDVYHLDLVSQLLKR